MVNMLKIARSSEYKQIMHCVTVPVAAELFGRSESGVRTDIQMGYLAGHKQGKIWLVSWASCCRLYGDVEHRKLLDKISL